MAAGRARLAGGTGSGETLVERDTVLCCPFTGRVACNGGDAAAAMGGDASLPRG